MLMPLVYAVLYSLTGIALLLVGFLALDLVTPGNLGERIYTARSLNASIVVSAAFLGLGAVVATALWTNADAGVGAELAWTVGFGLLGVALQVLSFVLLDALTPGSLREIAVADEFHPGALVAAASMLAVSVIVCVCIS